MNKKYKYYNNGKNEKRILIGDTPPIGWKIGRLKSPITTKNKYFINICLLIY